MSDKSNPYLKGGAAKTAGGLMVVLLGFLVMCCCGGLSQFGDYIGPPSGLDEYRHTMMVRLVICILVGLAIVMVGIWRIVKSRANTNSE